MLSTLAGQLSQATESMASIQLTDTMMIYGGKTSSGVQPTLLRYNVTTDAWIQAITQPTLARALASVAMVPRDLFSCN